jgi:hypothetical protein
MWAIARVATKSIITDIPVAIGIVPFVKGISKPNGNIPD